MGVKPIGWAYPTPRARRSALHYGRSFTPFAMPSPFAFLTLLLLLFTGTRGLAQTAEAYPVNDALAPVLAAVDTTWKTDPAAAITRVDGALLELPGLDSVSLIEALRAKGRAHRLLGDYVVAIEEWQVVYAYATHRRDSLMLVEAAKQIGGMMGYMGNYLVAQEYLLQVAAIQDEIGTVSQQASALNGLAIHYKDLGREEDAIDMYEQSLALFEAADDTLGRAAIHANLGLLYTERGEYEAAERHLMEQGRLHGAASSDYGLAFYHEFLGVLRQKQGRLREALPLALKSLELREALPSHYNIAESSLTVADILLDLKRPAAAADYARRVLARKADHQSLTQEQRAYETLSEAEEQLGNHAAALGYYREYKTVSDSLYRRDHLSEITNKDALYQAAKREEEIAQLGRANAVAAVDLQRKNFALGVTAVGLFLLTGVALAIYTLFCKISREKAKVEVLNGQKDLLLREIHHRVKNNLQMVSSLLSLQSDFIEDDAALDAIQMGRSRVRSMAIIHQRLYMRHEVDTAVSAREYLNQLITELMQTLNVDGTKLRLDKQIEDIELDIDRLIPLGLVANEVITNTMKYAFTDRQHGRLSVGFRRDGDWLELLIKDDGRGLEREFDPDGNSFGSLLIRTFTEQLDGTLEVLGTDGTSVRLRFPAEK